MKNKKIELQWAMMIYAKGGYPKGKSIRGFIKMLKQKNNERFQAFNKKATKISIDRKVFKQLVNKRKSK